MTLEKKIMKAKATQEGLGRKLKQQIGTAFSKTRKSIKLNTGNREERHNTCPLFLLKIMPDDHNEKVRE